MLSFCTCVLPFAVIQPLTFNDGWVLRTAANYQFKQQWDRDSTVRWRRFDFMIHASRTWPLIRTIKQLDANRAKARSFVLGEEEKRQMRKDQTYVPKLLVNHESSFRLAREREATQRLLNDFQVTLERVQVTGPSGNCRQG